MIQGEFEEKSDDNPVRFYHKDLNKDMMLVEIDTGTGTLKNSPYVLLLKKVNERIIYNLSQQKFSGTVDLPDSNIIISSDQHSGIEGHFISPTDHGYIFEYLINNRKAISNFADLLSGGGMRSLKEGLYDILTWTKHTTSREMYRVPEIPIGSANARIRIPDKTGVLVSSLSVGEAAGDVKKDHEIYPAIILIKAMIKLYEEFSERWKEAVESDDDDLIEDIMASSVDVVMYDIQTYGGAKHADYSQAEQRGGSKFTDNLPVIIDQTFDTKRKSDAIAIKDPEELIVSEAWNTPTNRDDSHGKREKLQPHYTAFEDYHKDLFKKGTILHAFMEIGGRLYWNKALDDQLLGNLEIEGSVVPSEPMISTFIITEKWTSYYNLEYTIPSNTPYIEQIKGPNTASPDYVDPIVIDSDTFFSKYINPSTNRYDSGMEEVERDIKEMFGMGIPSAIFTKLNRLAEDEELKSLNKCNINEKASPNLFWELHQLYSQEKAFVDLPGDLDPLNRHNLYKTYHELMYDMKTKIEDYEMIKNAVQFWAKTKDEPPGTLHIPDDITDKKLSTIGTTTIPVLKDKDGNYINFVTATLITGVKQNSSSNKTVPLKSTLKGPPDSKDIMNLPDTAITSDKYSVHSTLEQYFSSRARTDKLVTRSKDEEIKELEYPFGITETTINELAVITKTREYVGEKEVSGIEFEYPVITTRNSDYEEATVKFYIVKITTADMEQDAESARSAIRDGSHEIIDYCGGCTEHTTILNTMAASIRYFTGMAASRKLLIEGAEGRLQEITSDQVDTAIKIGECIKIISNAYTDDTRRIAELEDKMRVARNAATLLFLNNPVTEDRRKGMVRDAKNGFISKRLKEDPSTTQEDVEYEYTQLYNQQVEAVNRAVKELIKEKDKAKNRRKAANEARKKVVELKGDVTKNSEAIKTVKDMITYWKSELKEFEKSLTEFSKDWTKLKEEMGTLDKTKMEAYDNEIDRIDRLLKFIIVQQYAKYHQINQKIKYLNRLRKFYQGETSAGDIVSRMGFNSDPVAARASLKEQFKTMCPTFGGKLYPILDNDLNFNKYINETLPYTTTVSDYGDFDKTSAIFNRYFRIPLFGKCIVPKELMYFKLKYKGSTSDQRLPESKPVLFSEMAMVGNNPSYSPLNTWPGGVIDPDSYDNADKLPRTPSEEAILKQYNENLVNLIKIANQDVNPVTELTGEDTSEMSDSEILERMKGYEVTATLSRGKLRKALGGSGGTKLGVALGLVPYRKDKE